MVLLHLHISRRHCNGNVLLVHRVAMHHQNWLVLHEVVLAHLYLLQLRSACHAQLFLLVEVVEFEIRAELLQVYQEKWLLHALDDDVALRREDLHSYALRFNYYLNT